MNHSLIPLATLVIAINACTPSTPTTEPPVIISTLSDAGVRFDGVYRYQPPGTKLNYLMRFFPEGNVVLVNGPDTTPRASLLRLRLVQNAPQSPNEGLYNVSVVHRNDSLLWVTYGTKGSIDYAGVMLGADSVRFNKYSHVNGRSGTMTLLFEPDRGS